MIGLDLGFGAGFGFGLGFGGSGSTGGSGFGAGLIGISNGKDNATVDHAANAMVFKNVIRFIVHLL
jgi:hypothetical protein